MPNNPQEADRAIIAEADTLIAEGDKHRDAKELPAAITPYSKALDLRRKAYGNVHEMVAVALNRLANIYFKLERHEEAFKLFEEALKIREKVLAPDAVALRLSVNNLANCYRNLGEYEEAEILYRRSLQMREKESGHAEHPAIWKNLVSVLKRQGKMKEVFYYSEKIRAYEAAKKAE